MRKLRYLMITLLLVLSAATVNAKDWDAVKAKALAGDVMAQVHMGDYYYARNRCAESVPWYQMAAMQGQFDARHRLVHIYYSGACNDVEQDIVKAYVLMSKMLQTSHLHGDTVGLYNQLILELENKMTPAQHEEAQRRMDMPLEF